MSPLLFVDILSAVFERHRRDESESLRQLVVIEEAHCFTRKRIGVAAEASGVWAEQTTGQDAGWAIGLLQLS